MFPFLPSVLVKVASLVRGMLRYQTGSDMEPLERRREKAERSNQQGFPFGLLRSLQLPSLPCMKSQAAFTADIMEKVGCRQEPGVGINRKRNKESWNDFSKT